ncbi:MAG: SMC family ATPase [Pseudomonadota bacterium]
MVKYLFLEQLKKALSEIGGPDRTIQTIKECPTSDFVLRTPCYIAFFVVVEQAGSLAEAYRKAQAEIVQIRSMMGAEWPRDLNLVLLVGGDTHVDSASRREIIDDRYVCRKFVLNVNGGDIRDVLGDLPFWPPGDLISGLPTSVVAGVREAVKGYDSRLIADLASHSPGAERIFQKILEGTYSSTGEPSRSEEAITPRVIQSLQTKLEALDITDFRGIRRLRPEDMPLAGDVVFVYGPNGVGKTSIVDAVEWAISGQVSRLARGSAKGGLDPIINVFADKGEAQVICHLSNRQPICRRKRGRLTERRIGSHSAADDRAIIDHVVGTKAPSPEARLGIGRLRDLFRGSHILSQHNIRQFLEQTEPAERFDILTNMIGAEEFVRFREKVATVLRHLRSHIGVTSEKNKSLRSELEDVSTRLRERQKDFQKLRDAVTIGVDPANLASELLQGLRRCQCTVDEAAIDRAGSESAEHRLELIAVHAEAAIRGKKAAIEDLQVRLNSLEKELQGYIQSRTRCQSLLAEIASSKSASEKGRNDLKNEEKARQDIQTRLQILRTAQSKAARRYVDLVWLKENLPAYYQGCETLKRTEESLNSHREGIQRAEAALEERKKFLSAKRSLLQDIEQKIAARASRDQALSTLLKQLPQVQGRHQDLKELGEKERQYESRIVELKRQVNSARNEVNVARARLEELQRAYNSEAARHDVLSSFLAKLAELIQSAECPLCGRGFNSNEEAKDVIREHLSAVPLKLKELVHQVDDAKKDIESKQAHFNSITVGIHNLEAELKEVRTAKAIATKAMQEFVTGCATLSIVVSAEDTVSWQRTIEEARKECDVASLGSEAASLRNAITSLSSGVVDQQNVINGLRQKAIQDEKQRTQLVAMVQEFKSEMMQRGFETGSLPEGDWLTAEIPKAQAESEECSGSVAKREAELRTIDSAIEGLRDSLKKIDEDIASKEKQMRQYESICNNFIAACRLLGIDPESPIESIRSVRQRSSELNQSLSGLEEKRRVLQQVAGLGRLKLEIDSLAEAEANVKRRAEASSNEESRLRDWTSLVKGLEAEVVRQQVGVISSHLERLEPTTQRLYYRLNPHPIFGKVRIRVHEKTRELDIEAEASVARERLGDIAVSPSAFFSDAQMNSLAITVFLAGTLRQRWSKFNTIFIDDPVQQMDEMNVSAFLDLIRGLSNQRQFIIFTCNRDFYLLALEKLDCLNKSNQETFRAYRLEGIAPADLKVYCDAP